VQPINAVENQQEQEAVAEIATLSKTQIDVY